MSRWFAESERGGIDPQLLGRVSATSRAEEVQPQAEDYAAIKAGYLERYPQASANFLLKDFSFFCIPPEEGRYVAGFGRIFNLTAEDFRQAAAIREDA
ncbi:MAG: hypothetical protein FJZ96_02410 [Chloroflexi bacterium]|nr:hypothetical protein [Chloroflexota bacterium]